MSLKLYVGQQGGDPLVSLVIKLMQIENVQTVTVADPSSDEGQKIVKKSLTGRLPLLETPEGLLIAESLPIARYLSKEHATFQGSNPTDRKSFSQLSLIL